MLFSMFFADFLPLCKALMLISRLDFRDKEKGTANIGISRDITKHFN